MGATPERQAQGLEVAESVRFEVNEQADNPDDNLRARMRHLHLVPADVSPGMYGLQAVAGTAGGKEDQKDRTGDPLRPWKGASGVKTLAHFHAILPLKAPSGLAGAPGRDPWDAQ